MAKDTGGPALFPEGKVKIIVRPGSKKNEILGYDEDKKAYRIAIEQPADRNRANIELIRFLKKITKKEVRIISGLRSKEKILEIN